MKRHVRHVLKDENPTIWVGKDGLTSQLISEIEKQLQQNKMVKVRILPAALQGDNAAQAIAAKAANKLTRLWLRLEVTCLFFSENVKQQNLQNQVKPTAKFITTVIKVSLFLRYLQNREKIRDLLSSERLCVFYF